MDVQLHAILLEFRDFIVTDRKTIYGAFIIIPVVGEIGLGFAQETYDPLHSHSSRT